jgi:hypothetical protein
MRSRLAGVLRCVADRIDPHPVTVNHEWNVTRAQIEAELRRLADREAAAARIRRRA